MEMNCKIRGEVLRGGGCTFKVITTIPMHLNKINCITNKFSCKRRVHKALN